MGGTSLSGSVLELPDGDLVILQEDGTGVWLTRAKAKPKRKPRPFNKYAYHQRVLTDMRVLEEQWTPTLRKFFADQAATLSRRFSSRSRRSSKVLREMRRNSPDRERIIEEANAKAKVMLDDFFDEDAFASEFADMMSGLYDDVVDVALTTTSLTMGIDFSVAARKEVVDKMMKRANQLSGGVSKTTYADVQRAMRDAIADGASIPDIADAISSSLLNASQWRAELIARTEVVSSYNGGVYEAGQTLPDDVAAGMVWIATSDERTRPSHLEADGQIAQRGESFIIEGEELQYPGDPEGSPENTINCRCATAILTPDDIEGRIVPMHTVGDVLVTMALQGLSYRQALHELDGRVLR